MRKSYLAYTLFGNLTLDLTGLSFKP